MVILSRIVPHKILPNFYFKVLGKNVKLFSTMVQTKLEIEDKNDDTKNQINEKVFDSTSLTNYRFIYPEFLPDPNPLYRNNIREKLEQCDMLARRSVIAIPEFYVGSILAVTYSEPHATEKINTFVGICIARVFTGLRAAFILRNVVNGEGVEVRYNLYDPAIRKIDCLKLEKRLDNELYYLRDAPLEYSTFPFDMESEMIPDGYSVPVNKIKVPLKPQPWSQKWELLDLKGVTGVVVNQKREKKAKAFAKPWEKYDLMKIYRETIPEEEQIEIFSNVHREIRQLEVQKHMMKRRRRLNRPKKLV